MILTLPSDLEGVLREYARRRGTNPETLALEALRERFATPTDILTPRDDWERSVLSAGSPCGGLLTDEALSSDGLYE